MKQLYKIFRLRQPSSKVDKDLYFLCGFRPLVIKGYCMDSGGRNFMYVRDFTADDEVLLRDTSTSAKDHDNDDSGIELDDQGFAMKSHSTLLDRNSAEIMIEAYGDLFEGEIVTIGNALPLRDENPFGAGAQYDADINADGVTGRANPEFSDSGVYRID